MSGAIARYPAAASASNWCRHEYQHSGKPWQRSTVGPLPASARCIRMPFVSINRCEIVIANLRKIIGLIANQSHCELQPQPKWLRRHPVERRTAKTTCSTNLFSSPHRASGSIGARSASGHECRPLQQTEACRFVLCLCAVPRRRLTVGESITDAASRKVHPSHHCWLTSTCAGLCWDGRCSGSSKASARIVTYADDLVILCRRGKAEEALQQLRMIMGKLKLTVNEEKTRICKVPEGCVHSRR